MIGWTTIREVGCDRESTAQERMVLALPMRLWKNVSKIAPRREKSVEERVYTKLWVHSESADKRKKSQPRYDEAPYLCDLASDEATLYAAESQGLAQLRWAWDQGVSALVRPLREFSGRYVPYLSKRVGFRSDRQQWGLRTCELSLGVETEKLRKQTKNNLGRHERRNEVIGEGVFAKIWDRTNNNSVSLIKRGGDAATSGETQSLKKVYDILNCGERNRFVVRGSGEPFIVHNCTQALCRIIMGDIMLAIRDDFKKRGWSRDDAHLCLTVHDEVIVCCKDELAEEVAEIMQYQMKKSRGWYSDLPLDCAGDIAQRYGCAK